MNIFDPVELWFCNQIVCRGELMEKDTKLNSINFRDFVILYIHIRVYRVYQGADILMIFLM